MRNSRLMRWSTVLALVLSLSGCWDRRELTDLALVSAIAIDRGTNGQVRVSVQVVIPPAIPGAGKPGTSGADGRSFYVLSAEGGTVSEAWGNMQQAAPRQFFVGHAKVIVVSESIAREGMAPYLSFMDRSYAGRLPPLLCVTSGQAAAVLTARTALEAVSSKALLELPLSGPGPDLRFRDFLVRLNDQGIDPLLVRVDAADVTPPGSEGIPGTDELRIGGLAAFRGDKMAGWLTGDEARGALWFFSTARSGPLSHTVPVPESGGGRPGRVELKLIRSRTTLQPVMAGGRLTMRVVVDAEAGIVETMTPLDTSKPETLFWLERLYRGVIQDQMEQALEKTREVGADIFGFGQVVHRRYPTYWRQVRGRWAELYPTMPVVYDISARIRWTGQTNRDPLFKEQEYRKGGNKRG